MNRRTLLAATATGATAATAGCGFLGETDRLAAPEERSDADGRQKHLVFDAGGIRLAAISLAQRTEQDGPGDEFKLRLHLSHRSSREQYDDPTTVDRFQFELRTPPTTDHAPAEVFVQAPRASLGDVIDVGVTDDGWTRIGATDPGDLGEGTINIGTIVSPVGSMGEELDFRAEATLSESGLTGTTYELDAATTFAPVRG